MNWVMIKGIMYNLANFDYIHVKPVGTKGVHRVIGFGITMEYSSDLFEGRKEECEEVFRLIYEKVACTKIV